MTWEPIESLSPGRLALLDFTEPVRGRWIGYVGNDGLCEWPHQVRGIRPAGWQKVIADLTRLRAVGLH
jgi:hypothetical protein